MFKNELPSSSVRCRKCAPRLFCCCCAVFSTFVLSLAKIHYTLCTCPCFASRVCVCVCLLPFPMQTHMRHRCCSTVDNELSVWPPKTNQHQPTNTQKKTPPPTPAPLNQHKNTKLRANFCTLIRYAPVHGCAVNLWTRPRNAIMIYLHSAHTHERTHARAEKIRERKWMDGLPRSAQPESAQWTINRSNVGTADTHTHTHILLLGHVCPLINAYAHIIFWACRTCVPVIAKFCVSVH